MKFHDAREGADAPESGEASFAIRFKHIFSNMFGMCLRYFLDIVGTPLGTCLGHFGACLDQFVKYSKTI